MKLANTPRLFTVSIIFIALAVYHYESTSKTEQKTSQPITSPKGHAVIAKAIPAMLPTFSPTFASTLKPTQILPAPTGIPATLAPTATPQPAIYRSFEFLNFINQVKDGEAGVVKGVFVDGTLALKVVQQPEKNWKFVSEKLGTATQFQSATANEIVGLLAHNYLSGKLFYKLKPGMEVGIIFGDGAVKVYKIQKSASYKKMDSSSLTSDLVEQSTGQLYSTQEVFDQFYTGRDHITFQTCLERDGNWSWGLYFVMAVPE